MSVRAMILTQMTGGVAATKQVKACWDYIVESDHLCFGGMLRQGAGAKDAADSVRVGDAEVVVAAYRVPDLELTGEIKAAGGDVEYVYTEPPGPLTVRSVLANLHRGLGWSAQRIAREVGGSTDDVVDHLRRAGVWRSRRRRE